MGLETEEQPWGESTMVPSQAKKWKRRAQIFTEGVPELADDTTGFASIPLSQKSSAQLSRPNTLTFNGTKHGMVLRMHSTETLFSSEVTEQRGSCFSKMFSKRR